MVALVKVGLGRGLEGFQEHNTSTWNHNVDLAEFVGGLGYHTLNVLNAASIAFDE